MTQTRTILLAQEFGSNLGHVTRLLAVADALGRHRYVFAVPDAHVAGPVIARALGAGVEVVGGMRYRAPASACTPGGGDRTLGDVFFKLGYAHAEALGEAARRWRDLIDRVKPDLIVGDFTPTLRLASWDRVPVVIVGSGYETPPPDLRLPPIGPLGEADATSRWREDRLLETAQAIRAALGGPPLRVFADLFQGERVFVLSPPGFDNYQAWRSGPTFTPLTPRDIPCGPPAARRSGPDVFCFLWSDHPSLNIVLTALNGLARRSEVHIRGIEPALLISQCAPQVGIRAQAADFATLLPQTRLFIHYGGGGATYTAMLAGTLQLILPMYLEQECNALAVIRHGCGQGLKLSGTAAPGDLRAIIARLLDDSGLQDRARAVAATAHVARTPNALAEIVTACNQLMRVE